MFKAFLAEYLHVLDHQIVLLTNKAATAAKFLAPSRNLWENNDIDRDDAILFFMWGMDSARWLRNNRQEI